MTSADQFRILVICTGNRARSQMAHGWLRQLGGDRVVVSSAGIEPKGVHPIAIRVMNEVGVDISNHTSDHVDRYLEDDFELVLTVCDSAKESCPVFPGSARTIHRAFEDPDYPEMSEEELTAVFRSIRDEIECYARALLEEVLE
ncbi:MAG: arsenate reductase ArsC [Chloroflexi bacterium]|nr:arsenate reductase ArsC [Chloroflexota bacterium]MYG90300.1 arsenate reductase ArsC [Chloroflexota bacterium]MYJ92873.1 arsenate reductase ArsC [Chloroflexota bacterium]